MIAAPEHKDGIKDYQNVDVHTPHIQSCMCLKHEACAHAPDSLGTSILSQASVLGHVGMDKP